VAAGTVIGFRILGPLEVVDHEPLSLGGHKQQAVLAVLLLHRGEAVATDRLIEALWAGRPPATAGKTLQVYVSNLRKALGDGLLVTQGRGYMLAAEPDQVDSDRFEKLASRGREALEHGDPQEAQVWLEAALSLWRGPALADFSYESFAQSEIARLEEVRLAALESRIEADLELGRHAALVPELEALAHEHPLRERFYEQLMVALYRSGRQVDALERYQRARRQLIDEFGVEPGPRLQEIQRAVLAHDATLDLPGRSSSGHRTGREPRRVGVSVQRLRAAILAMAATLRSRGSARDLLPRLRQTIRRQLAGGVWAVAAAAALLVLAVLLVVNIGGHSGARPHRPGVLVGWAGIASPSTGGIYARGQLVATSFTCGHKSGTPRLASCSDSTGTATVSGGRGRLDTSTTGPHRYTVAATAKNGATRTTSISYMVVPPLTASVQTAVATAAHSRTALALGCSGGGAGAVCRGTLTVTVGRRVVRRVGRRRAATVETVTLARTSYSLPAGSRRSIVVPLTTSGTLALRAARGHQLRARAAVTLTDGATAARSITLKRRQPR
jgi:DNA-binding SARP family transcriptional activator